MLQISDSTCDGQPLHAYAKKAPLFKNLPVQKGAAVNEAALYHKALVSIVDKLVKYPQQILSIHSILMSDAYGCKKTHNYGDGVQATSLAKLPREFMANWLRRRHPFLTENLLLKLEAQSSDNIKDLFFFELQLPLSMTIPKTLQDNTMKLAQWLDQRAAQMAPRLGVRKDLVSEKGVDGIYELFFNESGKVTKVKHMQGEVVDITQTPHILIDHTFELIDNQSELQARVIKAPISYTLCEFFPETAKFRQNLVSDKVLRKTMVEAAQQIAKVHEAEAAKATVVHTLAARGKNRCSSSSSSARMQAARPGQSWRPNKKNGRRDEKSRWHPHQLRHRLRLHK